VPGVPLAATRLGEGRAQIAPTLARFVARQRIVLTALMLNAACSGGSSDGAPMQPSMPQTGGNTSVGGAGHAGASGSASLGASGSGGSAGPLTPQQAIKLMAPGWNLGNSFDATPNETSWGNPTPSQALINAVHAAGFKTLRLPVTWTDHIGPGPSYTIDSAWL